MSAFTAFCTFVMLISGSAVIVGVYGSAEFFCLRLLVAGVRDVEEAILSRAPIMLFCVVVCGGGGERFVLVVEKWRGRVGA